MIDKNRLFEDYFVVLSKCHMVTVKAKMSESYFQHLIYAAHSSYAKQ